MLPAQFRTSWAKSCGSGLSYAKPSLGWKSVLSRKRHEGISAPYNRAPVDANYEVEPWFHAQLEVCVAQHLESIAVTFALLWSGVAVEARKVAIKGVKHGSVFNSVGRLCHGEDREYITLNLRC